MQFSRLAFLCLLAALNVHAQELKIDRPPTAIRIQTNVSVRDGAYRILGRWSPGQADKDLGLIAFVTVNIHYVYGR